ncbi:hypothetical protein CFK37_08765 [Virgibacillus phasianinus]|uniref:Lipoprotein n=1 Tax=Virgibacillus phasianinus TaxID=2017483 RepID=A0A220U2H8_9BACI|nr:CueP family metal-binding protein [Virgibacillus phasianinus]ASK62245.1 hypothetical protein CFK37_08765 [Virgibacillus phasianinus]
MKLKVIFVLFFLSLVLVACSNSADKGNTSETEHAENIKKLVHGYSTGKLEAKSASITPQELTVVDANENEKVYKLTGEKFFVSIAPYVNQTHPCTYHSLTGCQGEMAVKEFKVHIKDSNGNTVVNKKMKSQENGFIDLWVPRNENYSIIITHNGKRVESQFSTFNDDPTCLTNMQLS